MTGINGRQSSLDFGRAEAAVPGATEARPPVILLGGGENALSVARNLGRSGIRVFVLNQPTAAVRYSRYCRWIPCGDQSPEAWHEFLCGAASEHLRGAVLLACNDAGIQLIAEHRDELLTRFRLDESDPVAQRHMLNKLNTYRLAREAGVPTPKFWDVQSLDQLREIEQELVFPLIVKPHFTHLFRQRFGKKFLTVNDFDQLQDTLLQLNSEEIAVVLMEIIPGPDNRLCSYYTYLDENQQPLFDFTKRIIRRFPVNSGPACYHITDWNPEVRDVALRLFQYVGLRGVANAEFKRDIRDGQLKLIECNARFTAANCLVEDSGLNLSGFVYNRIVGAATPPVHTYLAGMRLWSPIPDFFAFLQLRGRGELTLAQWIRSICCRQTTPIFRWSDPLPAVVGLLHAAQRSVRGIKRLREAQAEPAHNESAVPVHT